MYLSLPLSIFFFLFFFRSLSLYLILYLLSFPTRRRTTPSLMEYLGAADPGCGRQAGCHGDWPADGPAHELGFKSAW